MQEVREEGHPNGWSREDLGKQGRVAIDQMSKARGDMKSNECVEMAVFSKLGT